MENLHAEITDEDFKENVELPIVEVKPVLPDWILNEKNLKKFETALSKIFERNIDQENEIRKTILARRQNIYLKENKPYCFMMGDQESAIVFKNKALEDWFLDNYLTDNEASLKNEPKIDLENADFDNTTSFKVEHLLNWLKVFEPAKNVRVSIWKDKPIILENDDFKVIIAPRIESD